jgi:hypothetical protein
LLDDVGLAGAAGTVAVETAGNEGNDAGALPGVPFPPIPDGADGIGGRLVAFHVACVPFGVAAGSPWGVVFPPVALSIGVAVDASRGNVVEEATDPGSERITQSATIARPVGTLHPVRLRRNLELTALSLGVKFLAWDDASSDGPMSLEHPFGYLWL